LCHHRAIVAENRTTYAYLAQHLASYGFAVAAIEHVGASPVENRVQRDCNPNRSLNLSVALQCRAQELKPQRYALKDPRVKAILAINPLDIFSNIFSQPE
jgi:predicted dienelactone hydrolase